MNCHDAHPQKAFPAPTHPLPALACQHSCVHDVRMHHARPRAFPDWGRCGALKLPMPIPQKTSPGAYG
eukprot:740555-Alexandrium_andersonii.AAC.1